MDTSATADVSRAHNTTTRMRTGAAQVEAVHRRPVLGHPAWYRAHAEELIQCHVAVKDVDTGQLQLPWPTYRVT